METGNRVASPLSLLAWFIGLKKLRRHTPAGGFFSIMKINANFSQRVFGLNIGGAASDHKQYERMSMQFYSNFYPYTYEK